MKGRAKDKVAPALTPDVVAMVEALPTLTLADGSRQLTTASKRDRALLLVGFAGALRRSELAALEVRARAFGADGMRLRLRRSKSDQEGAGATLGLHFGERAGDPLGEQPRHAAAAGGVATGVLRQRSTTDGRAP